MNNKIAKACFIEKRERKREGNKCICVRLSFPSPHPPPPLGFQPYDSLPLNFHPSDFLALRFPSPPPLIPHPSNSLFLQIPTPPIPYPFDSLPLLFPFPSDSSPPPSVPFTYERTNTQFTNPHASVKWQVTLSWKTFMNVIVELIDNLTFCLFVLFCFCFSSHRACKKFSRLL